MELRRDGFIFIFFIFFYEREKMGMVGNKYMVMKIDLKN